MIQSAPGSAFEAYVNGFATGIGTSGTAALGARIRDGAGSDFLARSTTGITEDVTVGANGVYRRSFTAPTTAGQFWIVWDNGTSTVTEELLVTYSSSATATPSDRDLCTLADVQAYIPGYETDTDTDAILQELITAESAAFQTDTRREIQPVTANPSAKVFDLTAWDAQQRTVWIGDLQNTTGLSADIATLDGTSVASLAMTDDAIIALPRNREEWQPYNELWFPEILDDSPTLAAGYTLTVTGNWGFPSIPPFVRTAVIKLVVYRYVTDVALGGTAFSDAVRDADLDIGSMFRSAMEAKERVRFASVA